MQALVHHDAVLVRYKQYINFLWFTSKVIYSVHYKVSVYSLGRPT